MRQDFTTRFTVTSGDIIRNEMARVYALGEAKQGGHLLGIEATSLVTALREHGFEIVREDMHPLPGEEVPAPAHATGIDVLMSPHAERLLAAINHGVISRDAVIESWGGDPAEVDRRNAEAKRRAEALGLVYGGLVHADGEKPIKLEPGRSYELPHGTEVRWPTPPVISFCGPGLYELTPKAEAAIKVYVDSMPLTQDAVGALSDALDREIERSFGEPLGAVPDEIADQRAEAISQVIQARRLIAQAGQVLGAEAVEILLENLATPDLEAA